MSLQEEKLFWDAIDQSNHNKDAHWSDYDIDQHLQDLVQYLSQLDKQQLIIFEKTLQLKLSQLYSAEIAELSTILESEFTEKDGIFNFDAYLSDDGFIYFRCWLILKGKDFFDDIQEDIQNFVSRKYSFDIGDTWAEGLLYVADEAYSVHYENEEESEIRDAVYLQHPEHHYDFAAGKIERDLLNGVELQA
ncbi:DUF4240 domain-containing protein [Acinetobacter sp.]